MRRPSRSLAALAVAALVGGCGVTTDGGPHAISKSQVPFHLLDPAAPTTTTTTPSVVTVPVTVYFVGPSQQYLVPAQRSVATSATLTTVLEALLAGPTPVEAGKGIKTAFGSGVKLLKAKVTPDVDPDVATVDFNQAFGQISGTQLVLAVAQVVYTVAAEIDQDIGVQFEIAGQPKEVPTATGAQVPGPVHLLQYVTLTPRATPAGAAATTPTTTTAAPG